MSHYLFQFGHSPRLSNLELSSYLSRAKHKYQQTSISPSLHLIHTHKPIDLPALIHTLGGTVRIASRVGSFDPDYLLQGIIKQLDLSPHKINFSIHTITNHPLLSNLPLTIKTHLKTLGKPSRYLETTPKLLNPIIINSQQVQEFILIPQESKFLVFKTSVVSDYSAWVSRDRHRPSVDPKNGMLPPKIARIMVNLGTPHSLAKSITIYDPFCGSGTILAEALSLGFNVIGSDINPKAISDTKDNLDWLQTNLPTHPEVHLFVKDASTLSPSDLPIPISAIVTEVDLGPSSTPSASAYATLIDKLQQLYSSFLNLSYNLLDDHGKLVIALPQYTRPSNVKMLQSLVDTCENRGYTLTVGPLIYGQPHARVKRAIYVFEK